MQSETEEFQTNTIIRIRALIMVEHLKRKRLLSDTKGEALKE
jgi:hypothetical protein